MAFSHGKATDILFNATRMATIFKGLGMQNDVDVAETSCFLQSYKTFVAGQGDGKVDLEGLYDTVLSLIPRATLFVAPGIATIGPAGLQFGDLARLLSVHTVNYTESASLGDAVLANWSLQSDNEIGFGNIYRAPDAVAVTVTGNGTGIDLLAQVVAATWVFHAHVITITGTTPTVTLKVQDSADNVSFADLSGVTTTSINAAGAQRITGVGTVRRYARVVHTITGTTPSVVYAAAFSRRA